MKKNNLILGTFLAITAILFSGCGGFPSSESTSTEKVEGSNKSTQSGDEVTIGNQVWTSKNLDVATYRNGDAIPQVQDEKAWGHLTTGAWCYYNNDPGNGSKYGKLYNWYAVNDLRGLAPKGYHIPTDAEWTQLSDYLGGEEEAGTKMKTTSGLDNHGNGTNSSSFSGLPGGSRGSDGAFYSIGHGGYWWSSAEDSTNGAWLRYLYCYNGVVTRSNYNKKNGFSVRCLRD